jgi:hypothetical protein
MKQMSIADIKYEINFYEENSKQLMQAMATLSNQYWLSDRGLCFLQGCKKMLYENQDRLVELYRLKENKK